MYQCTLDSVNQQQSILLLQFNLISTSDVPSISESHPAGSVASGSGIEAGSKFDGFLDSGSIISLSSTQS